MKIRNWKPLGAILVAALLLVILGTVSGWMETTKYTLTITDGGTGLLDYALQVSVYKVNKGEGSEGLVVVDNSPSDPVKFELIPGTYQVSVAFDGVVLTFEPFALTQDKTIVLSVSVEAE